MLFGGAGCVAGNRLFQLLQRSNGPSEGPRGHDALAVGDVLFQSDAGHAAQLHHHALHDYADTLANERRIGVAKLQGRPDTDRAQPRRHPARESPQIGQLHARERGVDVGLRQHDKHTARTASFLAQRLATFAKVLVAAMPTETRNAGPLQDSPAQVPRNAFQARLEARKTEEGFVDGIDFKVGGEAPMIFITRALMSP